MTRILKKMKAEDYAGNWSIIDVTPESVGHPNSESRAGLPPFYHAEVIHQSLLVIKHGNVTGALIGVFCIALAISHLAAIQYQGNQASGR